MKDSKRVILTLLIPIKNTLWLTAGLCHILRMRGLIFRVSFLFGFIFSLSIFSITQNGSAQETMYEKITIAQETTQTQGWGVYDPSVEYGSGDTGWLVYSAFVDWEKAELNTHLAKTIDYGKTWTKVKEINLTAPGALEAQIMPPFEWTSTVQGVWRNETPTLLYDPWDPDESRRWKLFWVKVFSKLTNNAGHSNLGPSNLWLYGQVAYKYAKTPEELAEAKEIRLFGSRNCSPDCDVQYVLNTVNFDLKDVFFYMEPGSFARDGQIYLTLSAVSAKEKQRTIILSSTDHGHTWSYNGVLTDIADGRAINTKCPILTSSAIAEEKGEIFLLASPRGEKVSVGYNGVDAFAFEDITRAKLKRDSAGKLIVHKYFPPLSANNIGGGQSEYHEKNTYGGIIMSQSMPREPKEKFQIYSTKEKIYE